MRQIGLGSRTLHVAEARTPAEWARGLADREIPGLDGLLFIMPQALRARFHMRRVRFPILLALFDVERAFVEAVLMRPETGSHASSEPFWLALELYGRHATVKGIESLLPDLAAGIEL